MGIEITHDRQRTFTGQLGDRLVGKGYKTRSHLALSLLSRLTTKAVDLSRPVYYREWMSSITVQLTPTSDQRLKYSLPHENALPRRRLSFCRPTSLVASVVQDMMGDRRAPYVTQGETMKPLAFYQFRLSYILQRDWHGE